MARMARVVVPGVPQHITQRGVRSMGLMESDPLIEFDFMAAFSLSPEEWRQFLQADPVEREWPEKCTRTGRPCGGKAFVDRTEAITGRILRPRPPGPRPKK